MTKVSPISHDSLSVGITEKCKDVGSDFFAGSAQSSSGNNSLYIFEIPLNVRNV